MKDRDAFDELPHPRTGGITGLPTLTGTLVAVQPRTGLGRLERPDGRTFLVHTDWFKRAKTGAGTKRRQGHDLLKRYLTNVTP